jgi:uncharacterized protein (TIGR02145 family)
LKPSNTFRIKRIYHQQIDKTMKIKFGYLCLLLTVLVGGCKKDPVPEPVITTFTDTRDNHMYKQVQIGNQFWMAENLGYLPDLSSTSVSSETEPNYYVAGFNGTNPATAVLSSNYLNYGVLYNWIAAQTACPPGWHLPTGDEWAILKKHAGLFPGKALKSTSEWIEGGVGENTSGFNARPSGEQYDTGYTDLGWFAFFWTADKGEYRFLSWNNDRIDHWSRYVSTALEPLSFGYSVRCVKGE